MSDKLLEIGSILYQFFGFSVISLALIAITIVYVIVYGLILLVMLFFGKIATISLKQYLEPVYDIYKYVVTVFFGD